MAKIDDAIARIKANTNVLQSMSLTLATWKEGHATLAEEIADLKTQIANGQQEPDFSGVDTALDEQATLLEEARTAIGENTGQAVPEPPPLTQTPGDVVVSG